MSILSLQSGLLGLVLWAVNEPGVEGDSSGLYVLLVTGLFGFFSLASTGFWFWMLFHCFRNDPDRFFWMWLMLMFPPSTLIYFLVRWIPSNQFRAPTGLRRWTRAREIDRLEIAAQQIGNSHQFIQLGEALLELRQFDKAGRAFHEALEKDPENLQALWGAAQVEMEHEQFEPAAEKLAKLLELDFQYKFGDVSLAYGKTLHEMGDVPEALEHLEKHLQRWRHPEALYLLATLEHQQGNHQQARQYLLAMLQDINASPRAIARKFGIWKSKAQKSLKKLPR